MPKIILPFLTILQKIVEITSGIILGTKAVISEYCNISQDVTIGQTGRGGKQYTPVIANRVYIAPGAKIFGKIKIGNNVAIGANAVVTKDLPDNAVAVGVPTRIISYEGSKDFVITNHKQ